MDDETGRGERTGWPEQLCCVVSHSCPVRGRLWGTEELPERPLRDRCTGLGLLSQGGPGAKSLKLGSVTEAREGRMEQEKVLGMS